jgi:hypothetical protein
MLRRRAVLLWLSEACPVPTRELMKSGAFARRPFDRPAGR